MLNVLIKSINWFIYLSLLISKNELIWYKLVVEPCKLIFSQLIIIFFFSKKGGGVGFPLKGAAMRGGGGKAEGGCNK